MFTFSEKPWGTHLHKHFRETTRDRLSFWLDKIFLFPVRGNEPHDIGERKYLLSSKQNLLKRPLTPKQKRVNKKSKAKLNGLSWFILAVLLRCDPQTLPLIFLSQRSIWSAILISWRAAPWRYLVPTPRSLHMMQKTSSEDKVFHLIERNKDKHDI